MQMQNNSRLKEYIDIVQKVAKIEQRRIPTHMVEYEELVSIGIIAVQFVDDEVKLDVNISPLEKTIWINIEQISVLLERDRSVISKHIKNIFLEGELLEESVCAFFAHTANDGKIYNVKYYNLDI